MALTQRSKATRCHGSKKKMSFCDSDYRYTRKMSPFIKSSAGHHGLSHNSCSWREMMLCSLALQLPKLPLRWNGLPMGQPECAPVSSKRSMLEEIRLSRLSLQKVKCFRASRRWPLSTGQYPHLHIESRRHPKLQTK